MTCQQFYPPTNILGYKLFIAQLAVKKKKCLELRHVLNSPSALQIQVVFSPPIAGKVEVTGILLAWRFRLDAVRESC